MEEGVDPVDFFSVNRFLLNAIGNCPDHKFKSLASLLCMSASTLRRHLIRWRKPTSFSSLYALAASLPSLATPPQCYLAFQTLTPGDTFDHRSIELFLPVAPYHFDHIELLRSRCAFTVTDSSLSLLSKGIDSPPTIPQIFRPKPQHDAFIRQVAASIDPIPGLIRNVNPDIVVRINNDLSLIHMYG